MWSGSPWIVVAVLAVAHSYLAAHRLLAYLRYFQQEGYEAIRFAKWANVRSLTDPGFWLAAVAVLVQPKTEGGSIAVFATGAVVLALVQPDPRKTGKIHLKMTWRATRVLLVAVVLASALWVIAPTFYPADDVRALFFGSMAVYAVLPLVLIFANGLLAPYEQHTRNTYEQEAVERIQAVQPFIVGITGSYGKSSSKSMLAHLLQFQAPTLAAAGSINTLMGITRHIREDLVHGEKFMVVEMGAFKTGSIRRLCQLTPPSAGLITAVGDMHLERFGSLDEIVKAKSELAQAIPQGGLLVVNADSPGALRIAVASTHCRVLLYGATSNEDLETRLEKVSFSKRGTSFLLRTREKEYECFTPLLGRPIVLNLAGVFTLAVAAGLDPAVAVAAMRTLKPVSNRLEVIEERGITWVRDAYNSNQFGFRAALEVAAALPVGRRILATPGVIELGAVQFDVNRALSKEAAAVCDTTLIVAGTNKEAFVAGHKDAGREGALVAVPNRGDAFRWLRDSVKEGDLVILENDLPDLYERAAGIFWNAGTQAAS
ncbi:MAG TPA: Mur ligase family protein [Vicinamibacterales bacterium]|jgi:UDP-N-acetylmuramoyl-tripeptide--D-alanyl-D-alanine ligase|nr:Mur ligase family protein [Vicinamibacterales bacterium]